jgi:2'-5' RNA ligase
MRCFIAIVLPDLIRHKIAELQDELRHCGLKLRWVPPENIHLTLKFLGEITEEQAETVASILEEAAGQTSAVELSIEGVGQFPPKGTPRVVWLGATGDTELLLDLERRISGGLDRYAIPFDRKPFHPHLTIARVDREFHGPLRITDKLRHFRAGCMTADRVDLMKSDLRPTGAQYTSLHHAGMRNAECGMRNGEYLGREGTDKEGRVLLPRYRHCFVCGSQNPIGLDLQFTVKDGRVETSFVPREEHCGYRGVVHGGVLAAVLDECMGWTIITQRKVICISAEVSLRFKRRALPGRRLFVSAECVDCRSRLMYARGQITDEEGNLICTGQGKFIPLSNEEIKEVENYAGWANALEEVFEHTKGSSL